jgi:hypothetical protein
MSLFAMLAFLAQKDGLRYNIVWPCDKSGYMHNGSTWIVVEGPSSWTVYDTVQNAILAVLKHRVSSL